ncbi:MAG: acyltransferase domain-containing protein, partial [Deltaproteobacteria bacterium]|nr:acyltransferase domain-containing protein [Deltaproteobacteria bacterium]
KIYYESQAAKEKIAFLFSGQGSQYPNMGAGLAMSFSAARRPWDLAAEIKLDDECKLHEVVFPLPAFDKETEDKGRARLTETQWAQPAIGTVALSQLELLKQLGVSPDCTAGHSYGEIPALYAAGVIGSAEDLLRISRKRGELMANASSEKGAMTAVLCEAEAVKQQIDASKINVTIANINSPTQVVVTGRASDVKKFEEHLSSVSKKFRRLKVATAFHSELVSNCADEFFEFLKGIKFSTPNFDVYSNTTGKKYSRKKETIRKTLAWQLAKPVLFRDQVEAMYASGARVFLEVGPGNILSKLVGSCLGDRDHVAISLDGSQHQDGKAALVAGLGQLAVAGVDMDFRAIWEGFDLADRSLLNRGPNARTVKIKGSNYQKEYPPKNGAAGVPKPNTENQLTVIRPPIREETMSDSMNRNTSIEPRQIVAQQPALSPEWLTAFSELQRNALEAQKDFHNTISQSHAQFLRTSEVAFQQLGSMAGAPQQGQPMIATQSVMSPPAFAPEPCAPIVAPAPPTIMVAPESIPEPIAAAPTPAPVSEVDPKELLLEVVAEKTGYPKEMLDMQLDLETGLGIDSIKRVEILSALQQQMPELKALDASELAATKTLQEIMDVSSRVLGGEVVEIPSKKKSGISPPVAFIDMP